MHTSRDNSHQAFSGLFVLQATIAVVKDWEQTYSMVQGPATEVTNCYYNITIKAFSMERFLFLLLHCVLSFIGDKSMLVNCH